MDLSDVYTAFAQTKTNGKEESKKLYEFGSVVKHEENPCYRIER